MSETGTDTEQGTETPVEAPRVYSDDDLIAMDDFYHVLPIHPRTPYGWTDFDLEPDVSFPTGSQERRAYTVRHVREWYEQRPNSKSWRARVARAAQSNVVPEGDVPMTDEIRWSGAWIEGLAAGTEELIVRVVRPRA